MRSSKAIANDDARTSSRSTMASVARHLSEDRRWDSVFLTMLVLVEVILSLVIVRKVAYTEIDWEAYMQEVSIFWDDAEYDYRNIYGGTGPLVYPAGFLYLFVLLRKLTSHGDDIRAAQYYFVGFYVATQTVVLSLYQTRIAAVRGGLRPRGSKPRLGMAASIEIWAWRIAMALLCLSKRMHSIFLLRLFNDGPTMLLLYLAILLFTRHQWDLGCVVFSLAVSVKMNVLLFAPGLLWLLLQVSDTWKVLVFQRLGLCCALPQLLLGAPFLTRYPVSYLRKAFELDRVFFYKWTVNLKFLPEDVFVSAPVSIVLLVCHLSCLGYFATWWIRQNQHWFSGRRLTPHYIIYTMLVSNFVGIAFARTLHYQFYCWYFHAIPYLLWSALEGATISTIAGAVFPLTWRVAVVAGIEISFLTYPATPLSSAMLQLCHVVVLLVIRPPKRLYLDEGYAAKKAN